jgi:hypothetical protein
MTPTQPTAAEFADALEALAAFYRKHEDMPVPQSSERMIHIFRGVQEDELDDVLAARPHRIEPSSSPDSSLFVWDFGAGLVLARYVRSELIGHETQETSTVWKVKTIEELQSERARISV